MLLRIPHRVATMLIVAAICGAGGVLIAADDVQQLGYSRIGDYHPVAAPTPDPVSSSQTYVFEGNQATYVGAGCSSCGGYCGGSCGGNFFSTSPDHGWCHPVARTLWRKKVTFQNHYPAKWYGQPGAAQSFKVGHFPTVGLPTDTTQLGYYYHTVPTWQPQPGRIPSMPWPPQWHRRNCDTCPGNWVPAGAIQVQPQPTPANPVPPSPTARLPIPSGGNPS